MTPVPPRYAVLFRTHFWDEFAGRQYDRLLRQVGSGDVYVLVDETRGHVADIPTDRVFRLTDAQVLEAGYVNAGEGALQWFSGDVPVYLFFAAHSEYDYYLQLEYDVNVHTNLDVLMARVASDKVDVVASTEAKHDPDWPWLPTCLGVYEPHEIKHQLICLSIFSNKALRTLSRARLDQAERFRAGLLRAWPFCEAFIPTESVRSGLKIEELSSYGDISAYDSWPPFLEEKLPKLRRHAFVHPVLDREKYVPSLLKWKPGFAELALPLSWLHRRLWRLGPAGYVRAVTGSAFRQAVASWRKRRRDPLPRLRSS
jgi:hypothetical protein